MVAKNPAKLNPARIGSRVRSLREEAGLTQEKLAYECGYSKSYVSEIEAGKKLPSLTALATFASRLNVALFDLLVFPDESPRERLVDALRTCSPIVLREIMQIATASSRG